jgi:hypothetical protein
VNISWSGNLDSSSGTIRTEIVELKGNLKKDDVGSNILALLTMQAIRYL